MKTPAKGAATSIYLASSPSAAGITGRYFVNSKPVNSSDRSYDKAVGLRLWNVSAPTSSASTPSRRADGPGSLRAVARGSRTKRRCSILGHSSTALLWDQCGRC